ncbi:hypothetical protein J4E91_007151 [Alternaria rosae]|nr:hypothetical protein J4E91_007151 [Alternaria rosae]
MATTFHLVPRLPAELRVRIWHVALGDDYEDLNGRVRIIELHSYKADPKELSVAVSRRYPTLFDVNREARSEAAKAGGRERITMHTRFNGRSEPRHAASFKIYIDFSHDVILLSDRFIAQQGHVDMPKGYFKYPEETKLLVLMNLLPDNVIKIAYLMLTTSWSRYKGEHLEHFPSLKGLHLDSRHHISDLIRTRIVVEQYGLKAWESLNSEAPQVSCPFTPGAGEDTLTWVSVSGVLEVATDGIHKVEWGLRKDLWVPRAKKGSCTLQKIG